MTTTITFDDGEAYERYMGVWSQRAAAQFIDWLAPAAALRWLDVGCGNGAFTQMILDHCAPSSVSGVDPSEAQLAFARSRGTKTLATFERGDAMALPFDADAFDVAVMPLVIFFVPEPARGVAEMARVVRAGGTVAAYAWDLLGGGFPYEVTHNAIRELGFEVPMAPRPEAAELSTLKNLWSNAGLQRVETRTLNVERTFDSFDDYWMTIQRGPSVAPALRAMSDEARQTLKQTLRTRLPMDDAGRIRCTGVANAVKGVAC